VTKLVIYKPDEQLFEVAEIEKVLSEICSAVRQSLPGSILWGECGTTPAVVVRLNETSDAIWVDDRSELGFAIVSRIVRIIGRSLMLGDLQGNAAQVEPGECGAEIKAKLDQPA